LTLFYVTLASSQAAADALFVLQMSFRRRHERRAHCP
jgi:hypothetical protein